MEDDSKGEHVADWATLGCEILDVDYFGCHEAWCSAPGVDILLFVAEGAEAEVQYYNVGVDLTSSEHNIFRFEVSVHYVLAGHFGGCAEEPPHESLDLL